ncbi:MAG: iron-containing redox enzyme family protein [Myxococcales bacterium]|nr:iron-containing redox enzyme family protein [Myxococcales bacterium]
MKLTPPTELSEKFVAAQREQFKAVAEHPFFTRFATEATPAQIRKALLGFYPLIDSFPRWMATVRDRIDAKERPRADEARDWYRRNIKVERRHRSWWLDCGVPWGLTRRDYASFRPPAAMEEQCDFLRRIVREGTVAEAAAALNYAVEGATGEWTRRMRDASRARYATLGIDFNDKALRWVDAHAAYDDRHPAEALEVVKVFATDDASIARAAAAAVRSLEHYATALDDALRA